MAGLHDPMVAVSSSAVDPLPHQIRAVYGELLPRTPLRFLLAPTGDGPVRPLLVGAPGRMISHRPHPRNGTRAARIRFGPSLRAIDAAGAWPIAVTAPRREDLGLRPRTDPAKGGIGVNSIRDGAKPRKLCDTTYARNDLGAPSRGHRGSWQTRLASNSSRHTTGADTVAVGAGLGRWVCPCHSSERNRQGSCGDHADH